jgi:magnesium transporter
MLKVFSFDHNKVAEIPFAPEELHQVLDNSGWIDVLDPTEEEREQLEQYLRTELPESDDVEEIEASARYFVDGAGIHVHSLFLAQIEGRPTTVTVAFILQKDRLISLREEDSPDFRLLRMRVRRGQIEANNPRDFLISIFEQKVENLADTLEDIHRELEEVSRLVLEKAEGEDLEEAIGELARLENSNGKVRLCLMDTQRSISFLQKHQRYAPEQFETAREIMRDVETLLSHTTFLFEKINFLMDAAQGFINIEQNQVIKIFSIAAVVFLPPTMVASIYGMNFQFFPELNWKYGYVWALALMVVSGVAPYWYFKMKRWL